MLAEVPYSGVMFIGFVCLCITTMFIFMRKWA